MTFSFSKVLASATVFLLTMTHVPLMAGSIDKPRLYDDSDYNEYWEQQFLFDNGTMVTSQFLIANFPFSKQHGLMVATLKKPGDDTVIVKNGRKRDGWNFEAAEPRLSIFQHELSGSYPGYFVRLNNTAAEVDVLFTANEEAIPLIAADNALGLPEMTLYAPTARAEGRWRAGPEIGGAGIEGEWEKIGTGTGYGLHVIQRTNLNHAIRRWQRFSATSYTGDYAPILHAFETPNGEKKSILLLLKSGDAPIRFDDLELTQSASGTAWEVSAKAGDASLVGTLTTENNIEDFELKDHLEQLVAGSLADISRRRFSTSYDLTLTIGSNSTNILGNALAEDIILGEEKKKKRRSRR